MDLVEEEAGAALQIAVDGRGVPGGTAWRFDAASVEGCRDIPRRLSADIVGEDLPHDVGLVLDDLQLTGRAGHGAIAISAAAGVASIADHAIHAAPCVERQVLDEHFAHQCAQCAIKLADLAAGRVDDDAYETEPLARSVPIALIA